MRAAMVAAFVIGCGGSLITSAIVHADTVCAAGPTVKGIDVSVYQGDINWTEVAGAGIEFAYVRVSDGLTNPDAKFTSYWAGSRTAGIVHGAYQFFRPDEDPIAQADLLLRATGPMQADDLPPVLDVEVNSGLSSAEVAVAVRAWVTHVTAAIGRAPVIYTGKYFWDDNVGATDLGNLPLWHAQYTDASCPDISSTWSNWAFWQYSSSGSVAGISAGGLDVDVWNGDLASLKKFLGSGAPCVAIPAEGGLIDDGDPCFSQGGPSQYMRPVTDAGYDNTLVWTHTTADADEANYADWSILMAAAGRYRLEVYTAAPWAQSKLADYQLTIAGSATSVTLDQSVSNGWQTLGDYDFAAGSGQGIHLGDNTGEPGSDNVQLVFDAARLTPVTDAGSGSDTGSGSAMQAAPDAASGCSAGGSSSLGGATALLLLALRRRKSQI